MHFFHNGKKYTFNENDSRLAVEASLKTLEAMLHKCRENDCDTFYIVFLMAMKSICHLQLDEIGEDGIRAMFLRRMRVEYETTPDNEEPEPANQPAPNA